MLISAYCLNGNLLIDNDLVQPYYHLNIAYYYHLNCLFYHLNCLLLKMPSIYVKQATNDMQHAQEAIARFKEASTLEESAKVGAPQSRRFVSHRLVAWLIGCWVAALLGCLIGWLVGGLVAFVMQVGSLNSSETGKH